MIMITLKRINAMDTAVLSPYSAKDDVKALHGAHWDKDLRAWIIPTQFAQIAATALRRVGYEVEMDDFPTPATNTVGEPWEAMFSAVPVALRTKTFHALAKVFHPDAGGDLTAMQALTRAYSKIGA